MDKYNHWLGKLFWLIFGKVGQEYAVTLGQTTYYSCSFTDTNYRWRTHENCHKKQWKRDGAWRFIVTYLYDYVTVGYLENRYEKEARTAEQE